MSKRLIKKHPLAIRWFHWINFPVLFVMIWSGLLIYGANRVYRIGIGEWTLFAFDTKFAEQFNLRFRLAEGLAWHFTFMWIFALNGLLYVLYLAFSREWKHLLPKRNTLREAWHVVLHDLRLSKKPLPQTKFNGAQRIAYTSVILLGLGSLLSGLAIYKPTQFAWLTWMMGGYQSARWIHFWITFAFCAFFLVHIAQVIRAGWNNFRAMVTGYELTEDEGPEDKAA
ncbi:MAG: cytochrome b/b6 domain-containing protein [Fimbriimonadaceae bacterium]|nr:cytochrome b/b6 domain-containing protein [Fimbriimonadaceae bacterium]